MKRQFCIVPKLFIDLSFFPNAHNSAVTEMNLFVAENLISSGSNSQEFVSHKINLQVDEAWLVLYLNRAKPILFPSFSLGIFFFFYFFFFLFFFQYEFFFLFIFIHWRLITLQYCSGFCHTLT